jgi:hypothetical protein
MTGKIEDEFENVGDVICLYYEPKHTVAAMKLKAAVVAFGHAVLEQAEPAFAHVDPGTIQWRAVAAGLHARLHALLVPADGGRE